MPIVPTPAAARYVKRGQPKPPTPTINTLESIIFFDHLYQYFLKLFVFQIF